MRSVNFFEDAFSVLLFAYLGIKENKLGTHYKRLENKKFIQKIDEVEKRVFGFVDKQTVMKSCLIDEFYLINSHERPQVELRVNTIQVDIDQIEKFKSSKAPKRTLTQELPPIDVKKRAEEKLEVEIPMTSLAPTMSMPVRKSSTAEPNSPGSPWRRVSNIMNRHMTFEEVKKRRMTITSQNLMAKIQELQKKVERDDSSDDEPVTEVKFTPRKSTNMSATNESYKGTQADKAYLAKLGVEFNSSFIRIQEQIFDVTTMYGKKIEEGSHKSKGKGHSTTDIGRAISLGGKPKNDSLTKLGSPTTKPHKGRSIVKSLKPRIRIEKLTPEEVEKIRDKLLAERKVYKQKSVKTEEAAMIERYMKNKIFNETSAREKEYLCLGVSVFLK